MTRSPSVARFRLASRIRRAASRPSASEGSSETVNLPGFWSSSLTTWVSSAAGCGGLEFRRCYLFVRRHVHCSNLIAGPATCNLTGWVSGCCVIVVIIGPDLRNLLPCMHLACVMAKWEVEFRTFFGIAATRRLRRPSEPDFERAADDRRGKWHTAHGTRALGEAVKNRNNTHAVETHAVETAASPTTDGSGFVNDAHKRR
jgi:hypothetical protein